MTLRTLELPLSGFGVPPSVARIEVRSLTAGERLRRAAKAPLFGLGVAILVLPIPVVHLAVPPIALISSLVIGARRMTQRELSPPRRVPAPSAGPPNPSA